jgi:hypothetical protein
MRSTQAQEQWAFAMNQVRSATEQARYQRRWGFTALSAHYKLIARFYLDMAYNVRVVSDSVLP